MGWSFKGFQANQYVCAGGACADSYQLCSSLSLGRALE